MNLIKEEKLIIIISILSLLFCVIFTITNRIPEKFIFGAEIMNFLYVISISIIAAFIFYIFQIYIPNKRKRRILRKNLQENYVYFKEKVIGIFFNAMGETLDSQLEGELCDLKKFREFFKAKSKIPHQDKWDNVINGFNEILLKKLLIEMEMLMNEISFIINNTEIKDANLILFFRRLSHFVYQLKNINIDDWDEMKSLYGFLWEVFTGWSFVEGYKDKDIIEVMIEKI